MNSKKVLSLVLCMCMLVSLLTGCGLGGNSAVDVQLDADSQITTPVDADAEAEGAGEDLSEEILLADEAEINYETNFVKQEAGKSDAKAESTKSEGNKSEGKTESKPEPADKIVNTDELEEDPILQLIEQNKKAEADEEAVEDDRNQSADSDVDLPFDQQQPDVFEDGLVEYADNTLMVKVKKSHAETMGDALKEAGVGKLDLMFDMEGYTWYTAYLLKDTDVNAVLEAVRGLACVETAEYNFKYEAASVTDIEDVDTTDAAAAVAENPQFGDQWYMNDFGILEGWTHAAAKADGMAKGIIVAVIDTGVDYNHADLKANMWVNRGEIPDNGWDDDSNGYVDDYYGVDMTAKRGSGMDDHGHGTHVAGIIGAANNKEGIVGLAYDAQIMTIKAGDASGYFLQDNVAKSIIYAFQNGADVINMSFGGSASSIAVQDALAVAYNQCVLVASAGNECAPNNAFPNYPAAHKYVLGVMSVGSTETESAFTNYDVYAYSNVEYEVYAPGEQILSTLPDNRYAKLSGTSMAAPVVAAQAAILRSMYPDRNTYPTKYIYAQISGTAEEVVDCYNPAIHGLHNIPGLTNYYLSMTEMPVPEIGMSDYTLFDTETFAGSNADAVKGTEFTNNGDGIVDAGEVIALGMTLKNRWGMSKDTTIHIDATSDLGVEHPYVEFLNNDINYGSVGTYSESDSGKLYSADGEMWTGWDKPFYIKIDENIPNDYTVTLNVTMTYKNGLDETDETVYSSTDKIVLKIRRGTVISGQITEDMTLTKDHYYIIPTSTIIMEGVTVTVEPGTQIQFWCSDPEDSYAENGIAYLQVYGSFITNGTAEEPVEIFPSGWMDDYRVEIYGDGNNSYVELNHTKVVNPYLSDIQKVNGCEFTQNYKERLLYRRLSGSSVYDSSANGQLYDIGKVTDSVLYKVGAVGTGLYEQFRIYNGDYKRCIFIDSNINFENLRSAENCIFYGNNNYWDEKNGTTSKFELGSVTSVIAAKYIVRDDISGKTYMIVEGFGETDIRDRFFEFAGMQQASFNTSAELNLVADNINIEKNSYPDYRCGIVEKDGVLYNCDGSELIIENSKFTFAYYNVNSSKYKHLRYDNGAYAFDIVIDNIYTNGSNAYIVEIPGEIYITDIQLEDYLVNLDMNQTYQIHAQLTPHTADKDTLVYESLNEDVITVDETGLVTPIGQGTAAVKVYSPDYAVSNYVTFNVKEAIPLEGIQIEDEAIYLNVGEEYKLNLIFNPGNTTEKNVEYTISDDSIAVISPVGVITAISSGTAEITVTGKGGISAAVTVNVDIPVESISFTESTYVTDLEKEDGTDFYPIFMPENTTQRELIWESSNPEVCEVDDNGVLIKRSVGTAELKATVKGTDVSANITVAVIEELVDSDIVKIISYNGAYYDKNHYALMENGDVWAWGSQFTTPKKLNIEDAKDICFRWINFNYGEIAGLYVLNDDGEVYEYNFPDKEGNCVKSEGIVLKDIVAFDSSQGETRGSTYAISEDGSVWAWGRNNSGQLGDSSITDYVIYSPMLINLDAKIEKVFGTSYGALFLSEEGDVYECSSGAVTKFCSGAIDIYGDHNPYGPVIDFGNSVAICEWENYHLEADSEYGKQFENEIILSYSSGYYVEDGKVFYTNKRNNADTYAEIPGIDDVTNVFWFEDNQYFQTADGKVYAMGSASNNALGTGSTENAAEPVRMYFGLTENLNGLSVKDTNITYTDSFGDKILLENNLTLEWSQSLQTSNQWAYITLTDSTGTQTTFYKELNLNKLIIKPRSGFVDGETYTLTIPANAFKDRVKASNGKYTVTFTYYDSQQNVVKMMEYKPYAAASFKLALLEDESLWVWGCDNSNDTTYEKPTVIFEGGVKDFVISKDGQLYILDTEGNVHKYIIPEIDFLDNLKEDEGFILEAKIKALSSEKENCGSFFAIEEDGTVWAWGTNDNYQLGIGTTSSSEDDLNHITIRDGNNNSEFVVKVVSTERGTGFLTRDGSIYIVGGRGSNAITTITEYTIKNGDEVIDTFEDLYDGEKGYSDFGDDSRFFYMVVSDVLTIQRNFHTNSNMEMTSNQPNIPGERFGNHVYYVSEGVVYISNGYRGFFSRYYREPLDLNCVTNVFDFGDNVYVQTDHGQFYAFGQNTYHALGQKLSEASEDPVQVLFKTEVADSKHVTPGVIKMMSTAPDTADQRFALLEDGSLWVWGDGHEDTAMLFDRGVEDFMVCSGELYILDSEGTVTRYITNSDYVYSLKEDETFEPLTGIMSLSSETENYNGHYFAVGKDGKVYHWSYDSSTTTVLNMQEYAKKVVNTRYGAVILTRTGTVFMYTATADQPKITQLDVNWAANIRTDESCQYLIITQTNGKEIKWDFVYMRGTEYQSDVVVLEGYEIEETFDFPENFYFTAADGRFYGTGSGENNFLADSTIESSDTPVEIKFIRPEDVKNDAVVDEEKLNQRFYWSAEEILKKWDEFVDKGLNTRFYSNVILNRLNDDNVESWLRIQAPTGSIGTVIGFGGNYWGTTNMELVNKQILDFDDFSNLVDINEGEILTEAPEDTFPFVVDAYLEIGGEEGEESERVDVVGNQLVTFVVEFNRDMDTTIPLTVRFGSYYPYADYEVAGEYESPRVWKGTMQLTTIIENGYQLWSVSNGKAAGTDLKLYTDWGRFPFKIDTSAAQAMIMQAESTVNGINLTWEQDDFETLAGYNVYRSDSEDGYYTRLNQYVIPADTKEFLDDGVEPGKTYYYNFTVVQSDMTESEPSGKVTATALDTLAPNVYHTPVFDAFTGSSLVISANVTDNVGIHTVTLYYRTPGTEEWKYQTMINYNDKYSAVIPAVEVTTDGLEYYIDATDGVSHTLKGSADDPYVVTVKLAVSASDKGDVNGDGIITVIDAMMLLMHTNDRVNLNAEKFARADLNDDGVLTAAEALRIIMYANGKIGSIL